MSEFLTPEDFETIMKSATSPEEQQALMLQLKQAEQMRGETPQMRQAGRVSVAPNPLEYLAYGINSVRANKMDKKTMKQQQALIEALKQSRMAYGRNVAGGGQQQMSPAGVQPSGATTYGVP